MCATHLWRPSAQNLRCAWQATTLLGSRDSSPWWVQEARPHQPAGPQNAQAGSVSVLLKCEAIIHLRNQLIRVSVSSLRVHRQPFLATQLVRGRGYWTGAFVSRKTMPGPLAMVTNCH